MVKDYLKTKCERGDMILMYKMFSGLDDVHVGDFFSIDESNRTRGHNFKIKKEACRLNITKYFYTNDRVVDNWNWVGSIGLAEIWQIYCF